MWLCVRWRCVDQMRLAVVSGGHLECGICHPPLCFHLHPSSTRERKRRDLCLLPSFWGMHTANWWIIPLIHSVCHVRCENLNNTLKEKFSKYIVPLSFHLVLLVNQITHFPITSDRLCYRLCASTSAWAQRVSKTLKAVWQTQPRSWIKSCIYRLSQHATQKTKRSVLCCCDGTIKHSPLLSETKVQKQNSFDLLWFK